MTTGSGRDMVIKSYEKSMDLKELLYLRSRPWTERIKKNPWRTIWYALVDRFWYAAVVITGNSLLTMQTFWGARIIMPFPNYRCVLHHGLIDSRELPVEDFLVKNLKVEDVFMDIGANVGFYTLLCDALGATVYAFEPSPDTFTILKKNASVRATLVNAAVMDTEGIIKFTDKELASGTNTSLVTGTEENLIEVEAKTLDAYCEENNIHPTLLKIDVEGAEFSVVRGGEKTITAYKPTIVVETENKELVEYICSLSYGAFRFGKMGEIIPYPESTIHSPNLLFKPI